MTAPIGPGDKVICVDVRPWSASGRPTQRPKKLTLGAIYSVAAVCETPHGPQLDLAEIANDGDTTTGFYAPWRFRPAGRGGMFNSLLAAKPVRVGEDA